MIISNGGVNLIPFAGSVIVNGTVDFGEIIDNVLAFVPFGMFTGMLLEKKSLWKKIAPFFIASLVFEVLQFVLAIGASDITDLLTNTLGGMMGIGIFVLLSRIFREKAHAVINGCCLAGSVGLISLVGILICSNL